MSTTQPGLNQLPNQLYSTLTPQRPKHTRGYTLERLPGPPFHITVSAVAWVSYAPPDTKLKPVPFPLIGRVGRDRYPRLG